MWGGLKHKRALKVAKQQARSNSIIKQFHTLEMYMLALLVTLSYLQSYVYGLSKFVLEKLGQESNNRIGYIGLLDSGVVSSIIEVACSINSNTSIVY